jgi:hypothetical protein
MTIRRRMEMGDWLNGAALTAVGFFLGLALFNMAGLAGTPLWPLAIVIPLIFGAAFYAATLFDRLIERLFPSGVKPATNPQRRPIALLLSLPTGIPLGVIGAWLGVDAILS